MNTKQERIDMIAGNILSGNNHCDTLAAAVVNADADYFRQCASPVVEVYEQEAAALRQQRDEALRQAEQLRRVVEYLAQNLGGAVTITEPTIIQEMATVLGRSLS